MTQPCKAALKPAARAAGASMRHASARVYAAMGVCATLGLLAFGLAAYSQQPSEIAPARLGWHARTRSQRPLPVHARGVAPVAVRHCRRSRIRTRAFGRRGGATTPTQPIASALRPCPFPSQHPIASRFHRTPYQVHHPRLPVWGALLPATLPPRPRPCLHEPPMPTQKLAPNQPSDMLPSFPTQSRTPQATSNLFPSLLSPSFPQHAGQKPTSHNART